MRSIKIILSLTLSTVIVFVGITASFIYYHHALKKEKSDINDFIQNESTHLPTEIALSLWKYDLKGIKLLCNERLKKERIKSIKLTDDDEQVLFHGTRGIPAEPISMVKPVVYNGENIGAMELIFDASASKAFGSDIINVTFYILILVVCTAIFSVVLLIKWIVTMPLSHITQILSEIKNENYNWKSDAPPLKEIHPIIKGLKELSRELLERDKKISEYTDNLEKSNKILSDEIERRKTAESSLTDSQERFKLAMEFANDGLFDWNLETNEIYFSPVWKSLLGYGDDEIENDFSQWERLTRPEDVERSWKMQNDLITKKRDRFEIEFKMKHKDGHWVDILSRANAIFNEKGKAVRIIGSHMDISEQKSAEKMLQKKEEKLRFILDSLPDMVVEVDASLNVVWANKTSLDLNPKAIGMPCYKAFPGKETPCEGCYCAKAFKSGKIEMGTMYQPSSQTAGESYWENIGVPLKDSKGNVSTVLEVSRNVTEREISRQRELQLQEDLIQARKMESVGTLAGGIAHEFNNILSIIMGNNELIMDELPEGDPSRENSEEIRTASFRAREIVKQLLTFSRQDNASKSPIDMRSIVKDSLKLIRSTTPTNIEISDVIPPDCSPIVGNATQINQILINLCNNAADSLPVTGGRIHIELSNTHIDENINHSPQALTSGKYVKIQVSDNGHGMDKTTLERIFEPYFTTKDVGKGSGIGLAVVHGIIQNHGGSIVCESAENRGTTFTILLPAHENPVKDNTLEQRKLPGGDENILFVDDEPSIAKLGKLNLRNLGYNAVSSTDPVEALKWIEAEPHRFDLVISDVAMPAMTGDQMIKKILEIRPDMPTIICTGYSARMSEEEAYESGINAFLMKPLKKSDLAIKVRQVLDSRS